MVEWIFSQQVERSDLAKTEFVFRLNPLIVPANHDVVLRLIGSVANSQAQTGLLVSIGGANSVAQKELDANFFNLRLWQMPDLLKVLFRTYNELSDETKAKLRLKQIWVPMLDEGA